MPPARTSGAPSPATAARRISSTKKGIVCGGHKASYFKPGAGEGYPKDLKESVVVTPNEKLIRGWHVESFELYTLPGCNGPVMPGSSASSTALPGFGAAEVADGAAPWKGDVNFGEGPLP